MDWSCDSGVFRSHFAAMKAMVVSSMRFEKPHSLWLRPLARCRSARLTFVALMLTFTAMGGALPTGYRTDISATVTSNIRLLKPHSLSYQLLTLTNRPETLVSVASNTEDRGSWLKSTDTSGPVL